VGVTTVTCASTDTHGNTGSASFTITITLVPVTISVVETITVADDDTPALAIPVFVEETISVADSGSTGILDTTPPVLTLPSAITVDATSPAGATVTFSASATDLVSGTVPVTCGPPSGSSFAIGTTTVACSARDAAGNVANGTFTVTVLGAAEMLSNLFAATAANGFQQGMNLLRNAASSFARGNTAAVCGQVGAFANQVSAQAGTSLTTGGANVLLGMAANVKAALGCP
jgi:hypothetical protein